MDLSIEPKYARVIDPILRAWSKKDSYAGMHLVGWLLDTITGSDTVAAATAHGVEVLPLSRYAMAPLSRDALLLGYAGFGPAAIRLGVTRLAAALRQTRKQRLRVARGIARTRPAPRR